MSDSSLSPSFDGLMHLAKREGVDIRPTLLRVLTDLFVQSSGHSASEQQQYAELASRLIAEVDEPTRRVVRARLETYRDTPDSIRRQLGLSAAERSLPQPSQDETAGGMTAASDGFEPKALDDNANPAMDEASPLTLGELFVKAQSSERIQILRNLQESSLRPASHIEPLRAGRAIAVLERAAFEGDQLAFGTELANILSLPVPTAERIVADAGGELLACAAKALGMPSAVFQRILLFLKPDWTASALTVFRLSRLYETLSERAALIMLEAWRTPAAVTTPARLKYRPALYDDERRRPRSAATATQLGDASKVIAPLRDRTSKTG